jgi:hypothetical protein
MLKAEPVRIETNFYQQGSQTADFDLSGFDVSPVLNERVRTRALRHDNRSTTSLFLRVTLAHARAKGGTNLTTLPIRLCRLLWCVRIRLC